MPSRVFLSWATKVQTFGNAVCSHVERAGGLQEALAVGKACLARSPFWAYSDPARHLICPAAQHAALSRARHIPVQQMARSIKPCSAVRKQVSHLEQAFHPVDHCRHRLCSLGHRSTSLLSASQTSQLLSHHLSTLPCKSGSMARMANQQHSQGCKALHWVGTLRRSFHSSGAHQQQHLPGGLGGMPPEYLVFGIVGINALVYMGWQNPNLWGFLNTHFVSSMTHLRRGYLHTLLTSSASHQNFGHLFSNMFTLYFFGQSLVHVLGPVRVRASAPLATYPLNVRGPDPESSEVVFVFLEMKCCIILVLWQRGTQTWGADQADVFQELTRRVDPRSCIRGLISILILSACRLQAPN
jgi:hypothetical protein